ncbi:ARM repeat superfamily protein [Euphorbia peplus]|nr:ARM repeat superfamily protein [Euphorbia peplus]
MKKTQMGIHSDESQSEAQMVLNSNDTKQLETLISAFFSSQDAQKTRANNLLLCCKDHLPVVLFVKLIFLLRYSPNIETRANSARVIRLLKVHNLWPKLPLLIRVNLKSQFIECLQTEDSMPVLRILCGVVADLVGEVYKGQDQWEELFELLGIFISLENDKFQETALLVFSNVQNDCRRFISEALLPRTEVLHSAVLRALSSLNVDVKVAAFGAVIGLLYLFPRDDLIGNMVLLIIVGVYDLLKDNHEEYAQKGLIVLFNLVTQEPQFLKSDCVHNLVFYVLKIAESVRVRDKTKNCAIRLLMALLEAKGLELALQSLPAECMARLLYVAMRILIGINDDVSWYEMENVESDNAGKTDSYHYGIKFLNQLPIVLGKMNVLPIVFKLLPVYMDSKDWQRRHAGITLLGVISKDSSAEVILMEDYLNQVLKILLASFQDEHDRVCWAAFNFMHMPTDMVGAIQILHHTRIVPALVNALNRKQHPRVQEELVSALLFFVKSISQDCLTTYMDLDVILRELLSLLKVGNTSRKCRTTGLSIFNFVVKESGICSKHCASYLPFMLEVCTDKNSELRKEAFLGICKCAELGGSYFRPFITGVLQRLEEMIRNPDRSCLEVLKSSDIAVSTLGKIYEFHRDIINGPVFVSTWLNLLPIKADLTEAKAVHEQLCSMVERSAGELLGPNCEHLGRIVVIFIEVISRGSELGEADTIMRMKNLIKKIWQKFPQSWLNSIFFSLDDEQQQVLANNVLGTFDLN